ncbi:MAG: BrnA antitoxin family protein, partial [Methylobacterium sp.]|nr:BrnA antitoxin family protein [Methylobacterium sp.]
ISIRLDPDVLEFFKKDGPGYQGRINAVLRHYMAEKKKAG